jgi:type I restriction enzyme S subunit
MSEWREHKLGELVALNERSIGRNFKFDGIEYIDTSSVTENKFETPILTTLEDAPSRAKRLIVDGDTIISTVRPIQKHYGFIKKAKDNQVVSTGFVVVTPKKIEPRFLYYFLTQAEVTEYLNTIAEGGTTTFPAFKADELKDLPINLPDYETQTAIAEILSSLDDKIELNNKINQELETLAQTLFKQWFIDFEFPNEKGEPYKSSGGEMVESELGEIPKGWEVGYLEDVIEFHNGYAFSSKELESESSTDSYHVFKMGHIKKGGGLNAEGTKSYFGKSKAKKLLKYVLKKGDLLMCMTDMKGNVALLGHTALMNEGDKYIVNQRVGLLRPNNSFGIDYPYLYILTNSFDFIEELRSRANSGVQVNLSTNEIKKSKILIASKSINEKFDLITKSFYDKIFEITNENQTIRDTRDTLLPKLISGDLEINEISNQ